MKRLVYSVGSKINYAICPFCNRQFPKVNKRHSFCSDRCKRSSFAANSATVVKYFGGKCAK